MRRDSYLSILMDAEGEPGGGATPPPPAIDEAVLAAALERLGYGPKPAAPATADPEAATVSRAELARLRGLELKDRERAEAERKAAEAKAAEKGQWETIVAARDEALAAAAAREAEKDRRYERSLVARDLAVALSGKPLVSGAADQLLKLWADDFTAAEDGGAYRVLSADRRPVAAVVAERLASPAYAHFLAPTSRPGVPIAGGQQTTPTPPAAVDPDTPPAPKTLGEAVNRLFLGVRGDQRASNNHAFGLARAGDN